MIGNEKGTDYTAFKTGTSGWSVGALINNINGTNHTASISSAEAAKQRNWETEMSNTAYQRAVKDMQAAGLNPAMMFSSGASGASTPSGASGSSHAGNSSIIPETVNSIANLAKSFNYDKNKNNDMDAYQAIGTISKIAKYFK